MIVTNDCAHFIVGSVMSPPILRYTAGAVILCLVSAVSQGNVNCIGTELMQIFNGKIWPKCSVPVTDIKLITCSWLRLVRSKAQEPWLPWSDGYTSARNAEKGYTYWTNHSLVQLGKKARGKHCSFSESRDSALSTVLGYSGLTGWCSEKKRRVRCF